MTTFSEVIIDGDQMLYACGFASEGEPVSHTLKLLKNKLRTIFKDCGTTHYQLYIEGEGNFREDLVFDYKANRTSTKPEHFEEMKEYLVNVWGAVRVEGMETDDRVSIELYKDYIVNGREGTKVLSSPDKDLNNTPGWHYNPRTRETFFVTMEQAHRHFCYQLLCGDKVDNIKGLPYVPKSIRDKYGLTGAAAKGCGNKSAATIIKETSGTPLEAVFEAYAEWGIAESLSEQQTYDYLLDQWQLLWMIREFDMFGEPNLTHPCEDYFNTIWEETL